MAEGPRVPVPLKMEPDWTIVWPPREPLIFNSCEITFVIPIKAELSPVSWSLFPPTN